VSTKVKYLEDEIIYNVETKELFKVIKIVEDLEYYFHHSYDVENIETHEIDNFSESYMLIRFESARTLDDKIIQGEKEMSRINDTVDKFKWTKQEIREKLKLIEKKDSKR
jgi:hypothetical protein